MIYQMKTGKVQLKRWSDELRKIYRMCTKNESGFVISKPDQGMYTRSGLKSTWQRTQRKAMEQGVMIERFRFHDMKKKAASDVDAERRAFFLGSTQSTANRYNETADKVDPVKRKLGVELRDELL